MRTLVLLLATLPLSTLAQPAAPGRQLPATSKAGDEQAIRATFSDYQQALSRRDGDAAAALVDAATVRYYEELKRLALEADEATVRALALMDKLVVLRLRMELTADALSALSGLRLISHGVSQGWVGGNAGENALGELTVDGDRASGQAVVRGKVSPASHVFSREDGRWKMNLVELMRAVGPRMSGAARELGMSEDRFALFVLEEGLGKKPGPHIWNPLRTRAAAPQQP